MAKIDPSYRVAANADIKKWTDALQSMLEPMSAKGVVDRLNKAVDVIEATTMELVPEDTLATKNSWYRDIEESPSEVVAKFGYDKEGRYDYIPLIHEVAPINGWRKEGASTHFLSRAIQENELKIIKIITEGG